jgi:hypothetical protein
VDAHGNVYETGISYRETSTTTIYPEYATIKYDTNGNELWVVRYSNSDGFWNRAVGLSVDAAGNVYVTGESYDML